MSDQIILSDAERKLILERREQEERDGIRNELIVRLKLDPDIYSGSYAREISFRNFVQKVSLQTLRGLLAGVKARG